MQSLRLDEFSQDPARRTGVQKGHEVTAQPAPWRGVNQLDTFILQFTQG